MRDIPRSTTESLTGESSGETSLRAGRSLRVMVPLTIFTLVATLIVFIAWHRWDTSQNRGFEFGYYGEFNRVRSAVASIPGVSISESWHNMDVTLEEFGFRVSVAGQMVDLFFGERDPVRDLPREAAVAAMRDRIATIIASPAKREPG